MSSRIVNGFVSKSSYHHPGNAYLITQTVTNAGVERLRDSNDLFAIKENLSKLDSLSEH